MKTLTLGIVITLAYFCGLAFMIHGKELDIVKSWNELGDFLSGAFSPVAFLWLVLGYIQQQKELQQNTKALELQAEELRNSVEQYRNMVEVAREQLESDRELIIQDHARKEREVRPEVSIDNISWLMKASSVYSYEIPIFSHGHEARNVVIEFTPSFGRYSKFEYKKITIDRINLPRQDISYANLPDDLKVKISCESILGNEYEKVFSFISDSDGKYEVILIEEL
mgnify:CR=1 FL=1